MDILEEGHIGIHPGELATSGVNSEYLPNGTLRIFVDWPAKDGCDMTYYNQ